MKNNPRRSWHITLRGRLRGQKITDCFLGTYDEALQEADVMETHVDWQVMSITILALVK
jgi:hypothetical protein